MVSKLYPSVISFCVLCVLSAGMNSQLAYAQLGSAKNNVWERPVNTKSQGNSADRPEENKVSVPDAPKSAETETDKNLPNIVFGNDFTREIDKIRIQTEEQGQDSSGGALIAQKKDKKSAKPVCLDAETCSSVQADDETEPSLDIAFGDDSDYYIAPRVDGGIPKDQSTSAVGLQKNFRNNWNVIGAATFKGRGRGGAAAIGYRW